ncbi:MAG: hypothetical protein K1X86_05480 [Ignavibacteria bacterium]|nr:hypothetical protein [Ignavibacteria bacterium]
MVDLNSNTGKTEIAKADYPSGAELIGSDSEGLKIFIDKNVLFGIEEYLRSDVQNELGGVLTGSVYKDTDENLFIVISGSIIAESTNASLSRLTFTHETWEKINFNLEKNFPNKRILGWYHSHPGHSVFLSTYDVFIQDNFFNLPFMTAFVYDPVINDRGFFYKDENGIKKCEGYFVFGEKQDLINPTSLAIEMPKPIDMNEAKKSENNMKNFFIIALLAVNILFSILLFFKVSSTDKELSRLQNVREQLVEVKMENEKLNQKVVNLEQSVQELKSAASETIKYTIRDGENLRTIVKGILKDESKVDLIVKLNKLKNEFDIKPGQVIELPLN